MGYLTHETDENDKKYGCFRFRNGSKISFDLNTDPFRYNLTMNINNKHLFKPLIVEYSDGRKIEIKDK